MVKGNLGQATAQSWSRTAEACPPATPTCQMSAPEAKHGKQTRPWLGVASSEGGLVGVSPWIPPARARRAPGTEITNTGFGGSAT